MSKVVAGLVLCLLSCSQVFATDSTIQRLVDFGFAPDLVEQMEPLISSAISDGDLPGCVICLGRRDGIALSVAFGQREAQPTPVAMTTDTVFDMASLTKPIATATSVMTLLERGELRLGSKVVEFFPEFGANGKDSITVLDLLTHQSGLIPDNALRDYLEGPEIAWQRICDLGLVAPVGTTFKYSDVNFIVLGKLVESLSGKSLDEYSREHIFHPLGMMETGFNPPEVLRERAAPTEKRDDRWIRGEVHDPRAYAMGGVAGHAGLFSTAADLSLYCRTMLNRGQQVGSEFPTVSLLSSNTVDLMTRKYPVSSGYRGLGWDKQTGYSSNRGDLLSVEAFGHGGFTGTVMWIDPGQDLFFIFLSNRLHPDGKGSVNGLAGRLLNLVVSSFQGGIPVEQRSKQQLNRLSTVLTGADVLARDNCRQLTGEKVGLITNQTGRLRDGRTVVELLHEAESVDLVVLFSPEHGFAGKLDQSGIADSKDEGTGLTVYSLYGETRRPTAEMLAGIDTVVFDIQDIGCRFYTYISTMGEAMIAASESGKRFVVLDRPNPINGVDVAGPMLDPGSESFVGFHRLPVRHGMTIGEMASLLKEELKLELDLRVVKCEGWQRDDYFDATNLTWINPSPNMRTLNQAILYPGVGLLEMTNLSVGRGTDTPFELVGAPWIDGAELARKLSRLHLSGVTYVPIEFVPESSKYAGEKCGGISILITDRERVQPLHLGLQLARTVIDLYPEQWDTKQLNRLLGNRFVADRIMESSDWAEVEKGMSDGVGDFLRVRERHLMY